MPAKHIETLLTSVGVPAEEAATIANLPEAEQETYDVTPIVGKIKTNYQTQLQNDPQFFSDLTVEKLPVDTRKKIENASFGRASKIVVDKFLKGIGMSEADYADLPQETKDKIELLIPAIAEKYTKNKSGDKELQQQLIDARKQLEGYDGIEDRLKGEYETKANQTIASTILKLNLVGELASIPGLKIPANDLAPIAEGILLSKYGFERVGDVGVELRRKDNPQMKVLKDGSSQELTLKEALQQIAKDRNWTAEESADEKKGSGKVEIKPDKSGTLQMSTHVAEKINKKIAAAK